jgi:hypothetical protein
MQPPQWLDADFLYRINYGPAFSEDREVARRALSPRREKGSHSSTGGSLKTYMKVSSNLAA